MTHIDKQMMMGYIDGELSPEDAQNVREHLEACEECRSEHADIADFTKVVTTTGRFVFKIKPMTEDESNRYSNDIRHRMMLPKWRIAAGMCLLCAIVILLNSQATPALMAAGLFIIVAIVSFFLTLNCCCKKH